MHTIRQSKPNMRQMKYVTLSVVPNSTTPSNTGIHTTVYKLYITQIKH